MPLRINTELAEQGFGAQPLEFDSLGEKPYEKLLDARKYNIYLSLINLSDHF
jgi:hypothetical protein